MSDVDDLLIEAFIWQIEKPLPSAMRKSARRSPNLPMKVFIRYATEDYKETDRIFEDFNTVGFMP